MNVEKNLHLPQNGCLCVLHEIWAQFVAVKQVFSTVLFGVFSLEDHDLESP